MNMYIKNSNIYSSTTLAAGFLNSQNPGFIVLEN